MSPKECAGCTWEFVGDGPLCEECLADEAELDDFPLSSP